MVEGFPFLVLAVVVVHLFGVVFGTVADVSLAVVFELV
jgi:hypothetical protein